MAGQEKVILPDGRAAESFHRSRRAALEKSLEPAQVRQFLTVMRRQLAGPEGMVLKDVVAADPIGISALVLDKVLPLQIGFGDAQIVDGRITSGDGRHVLMMAEPKFPVLEFRRERGACGGYVAHARTKWRNIFPGVHVAITGGHRMSVDNATLIKSDATRCIFLGMAAMLVLCLTAFRRRWLALVAFLPCFFGTLDRRALCLCLCGGISRPSPPGFATIAIGITVDYAIYVIYHLDNATGLDRPKAWAGTFGRLVLPISVGALDHHRRIRGHGDVADARLSAAWSFRSGRRVVLGRVCAADSAAAGPDSKRTGTGNRCG